MSTHRIGITELSIVPVSNRSLRHPLQALVRIVLNDAFVVTGLLVMHGKFGLYIAFPAVNGKSNPTCFPIRKYLNDEMSETILNEYRKIISFRNGGNETIG